MNEGIKDKLHLEKIVAPVSNTRNVRKKDLHLNTYQPNMEVNPQTYEVRADGELLTCEPAAVLPMAQKYFLF